MKRVLVVGQPVAEKMLSMVPDFKKAFAVTEAVSFSSAQDILKIHETFDAVIMGNHPENGCTISFTSEIRSRGDQKVIVLHDGGAFKKHSPDSAVAMLDALGANVLVGPHYDKDLTASLSQALAA